jgi:hypothetical protein
MPTLGAIRLRRRWGTRFCGGLGTRLSGFVEADGGVALFVDARAGESAVARGRLEVFGGVLRQDERVGGEDCGVGRAAEEAERLSVRIFVFVGWVEEDDVEGVELEQTREELGRTAIFEGVVASNLQGGEIRLEAFEGGRRLLGEEGMGRAAGDGFDADSAGAGEEIGEP